MGIWFEAPFIYVLGIVIVVTLVVLSYLEEEIMRKVTAYTASAVILGLLIYTGVAMAHWIYGK